MKHKTTKFSNIAYLELSNTIKILNRVTRSYKNVITLAIKKVMSLLLKRTLHLNSGSEIELGWILNVKTSNQWSS